MQKKFKIKKKPLLEVMKASRVLVTMDTAPKVIRPQKGKGSYQRRPKHQNQQREG